VSDKTQNSENRELSRRQFLKFAGGIAAGVGFGGSLPRLFQLSDGIIAVPASEGYLLIDTKKCAGCLSCMMACSLVHEGKENLSLSRIQILQNPYGRFPEDISQEFCRQCVYPACVEACPTGALAADAKTGRVRIVYQNKCVGCQQCVEACHYDPSRVVWNHEDKYSIKCDLCANTPYWNEKGGPDGCQACIEICPMKAIAFTKDIPRQDMEGYTVNLRGLAWKNLGFPTD